MTTKLLWISFYLFLYSIFIIYVGLKFINDNDKASEISFSNKKLTGLLFLFTVTAASFSGFFFLVFPGIIFRDGLSAAYISFSVILIPLGGIIFFKRQWLLGKNFGYSTALEMFNDYFKSKFLNYLIIIITCFFLVPFLSLQISASGKLYNFLSNNFFDLNLITWILGLLLLLHVILGGLKSIAYLSIFQTFLIWVGIIIIGFVSLNLVGGFSSLNNGLSILANIDNTRWNLSPSNNYSALFSIPDLIQLTKGVGRETPVGGLWTSVMIFTIVVTFMGIQLSPFFSALLFSAKNLKSFAPQQVWVSGLLFGIAIFLFSILQGLTAHFLGASNIVTNNGFNISNILPNSIGMGGEGDLVLNLINSVENFAPWLVGILSICGLATLQSTGALLIGTGSKMIINDINFGEIKNFKNKNLLFIIFSSLIVLFSLIMISFFDEFLFLLGGVAISIGFQMFVPLLSICYVSWFTKHGVSWGLFFGMLAVIITDDIGQVLLFEYLPWGSWPFTIYSGFWGILTNLIVTIIISFFTQSNKENLHKKKFHNIFKNENKFLIKKKSIITFIFLLIWIFFAIGPGAMLGNDIFGNPSNKETWIFNIPSIWAWQILLWVIGIYILWLLAYRMKMSLKTDEDI